MTRRIAMEREERIRHQKEFLIKFAYWRCGVDLSSRR